MLALAIADVAMAADRASTPDEVDAAERRAAALAAQAQASAPALEPTPPVAPPASPAPAEPLVATRRTYCELVGVAGLLPGRVTVSVDYGTSRPFADKRLRDGDGDVLKFTSMVDAMNFMAGHGWTFEAAYAVSDPQGGATYRWLMSRPAGP